MDPRPVVLLTGETMLMEGVAMCLMESPSATVIRTNPDIADIGTDVEALGPDMIIFEIGSPQTEPVLDLLYEQPGTLLLGIDPTCNRVVVMNSRERVTRSMLDLCQVFQSEVSRRLRSIDIRKTSEEHLDSG